MSALAVVAALTLAQAQPPSDEPAPARPLVLPDTAGAGEAQVRAGFQAAEAARGPLDGRWRLALASGEPLYDFQISDSGGAAGEPQSGGTPQIEGAWRDLRRTGALDAAGVLITVKRERDRLSILFYEGAAPEPRTVELDAVSAGVWTGEFSEADARLKVVMTRQ